LTEKFRIQNRNGKIRDLLLLVAAANFAGRGYIPSVLLDLK